MRNFPTNPTDLIGDKHMLISLSLVDSGQKKEIGRRRRIEGRKKQGKLNAEILQGYRFPYHT